MASEAHDVETIGTDGGADAGMPTGLTAPGGDSPTPSGSPAGPAPTTAPAEFAELEWQMPFWARPVGHREVLELTETVRGAMAGGKLRRVDELGQDDEATPAEQASTARRARPRG